MNDYRVSPVSKKEYLQSRVYVMFKSLKDMIISAWHWWTWLQFFNCSVATLVISTFIFIAAVIYGAIWMPHPVKGCYVQEDWAWKETNSNDRILVKQVYQDVDWRPDREVTSCKDMPCVYQVLNSQICKPTNE